MSYGTRYDAALQTAVNVANLFLEEVNEFSVTLTDRCHAHFDTKVTKIDYKVITKTTADYNFVCDSWVLFLEERALTFATINQNS